VAEFQMTLVDRQRIAKDTMAFWFDTNGTGYDFRAGQLADFAFMHASLGTKATISEPFLSQTLLMTKG
jgi:hypothetical protein